MPTPKKKRGRVILLSVLGGAVLLTGIGIGTSNNKTTTTTAETPAAASASAAPAQPAPAPAPAPAPEGPAKLVIGQPQTITKSGKEVGTLTVTKVERMSGQQASRSTTSTTTRSMGLTGLSPSTTRPPRAG